MSVRSVALGEGRHVEGLAAHLRTLPPETVLISLVRPLPVLLDRLAALDCPHGDLYVIDATGHAHNVDAFRPSAFFIDSPTKLEKIALVARKVLERRPPGTPLVLDDFQFVVQYNGPAVAQEFIHLLANQCRTRNVPLDILTTGPAVALDTVVDGRTEVTL